jgi:hypothetical protein
MREVMMMNTSITMATIIIITIVTKKHLLSVELCCKALEALQLAFLSLSWRCLPQRPALACWSWSFLTMKFMSFSVSTRNPG